MNLYHGLRQIATITGTAPLVGLLGTVNHIPASLVNNGDQDGPLASLWRL